MIPTFLLVGAWRSEDGQRNQARNVFNEFIYAFDAYAWKGNPIKIYSLV